MNTPDRNYTAAQIGWDFTHDGVGDNFPAVKITAGSARSLHLVCTYAGEAALVSHTDAGSDPTVQITRSGDNAARISGLKVTVDNAGTNGLVAGIDLSSFAADEPLFIVPSDTNATAGTLSGQFAVRMGTTTYYTNLYTHG